MDSATSVIIYAVFDFIVTIFHRVFCFLHVVDSNRGGQKIQHEFG